MAITTIRQSTKKDKTQQLILDAAAKCFSKQGFHGTPLKDIAETVNMKVGSLYYHFPSKEMLMQEVLNKSVQLIYNTVKDEVNKLGDTPTFPELLRAAIRGHLIAILTYSDYTSASIRNYGQFPEAVHLASQSSRDEYEQFWRDLFDKSETEGAIKKGVDKHLLRLTIFGGMNWASVWFESNETDGASVESIADFQADLFLNGCRP